MSDRPPLAPDPEALRKPLARLLRPLVFLCIRSGLTFPSLIGLLRELYVNVAEHEFALKDKEQTDSRVSLLTGIHRKEVSRLRGAGAPVNVVPPALSRTSRIIATWLAAPAFTDPDGRPLPLPRSAPGEAPSFEKLVETVTKDVRPRAILDEWLDRNLVTIDGEERVVLAQAALVPRGEDADALYYLGRNVHDHLAAAAANVTSASPPFIERAVHYDGLSADLARRLEARARELALEALRTANREAHAACETDPGGTSRWNFGTYVYREDAPETPVSPDPGEGTPS